MERSPLVLGLAAVFAGCTVVLTVAALASREPLVLIVAAPFAVSTYIFWFQATGGLAAHAHRRAGRTRPSARVAGGDRTAGRRTVRGPSGGPSGTGAGSTVGRGHHQVDSRNPPAPGRSDATARRVLGVDENADAETVRQAYRDRVKEVHPDAESGTEEAFRRVQEAYDRLRD